MFRIRPILAALTVVLVASCSTVADKPAADTADKAAGKKDKDSAIASDITDPLPGNPFAEKSALPFEAPQFDRIRDGDFQPAIEEGMRRQIAEIERIANNKEPATFDNTLVAMEKSGALLTRVSRVFSALAQANTNDVLQRVQKEEAPKLAAHQDAIYLNAKLFTRVKTLYAKRDTLGLDAESSRLLERYYRLFVRAGAELSSDDQGKLRDYNKELSSLSTEFRSKLLAATKAGALVADDKTDLAGLSESDLAAALEAGRTRMTPGKYVIPLQNTTQQPALASLQKRDTREKLFNSSILRAERYDDNDTRKTITRTAELRAEKAKLLGYDTWAAYVLDDQMAKKPEKAIKLMTDMVPAAVDKAKNQAREMEKIAKKDGIQFKPWDLKFYSPSAKKEGGALRPWDWDYYAEQVRKSRFQLDAEEIKQYFELDSVLQNGVFFAANKLYGVTFKERKDIPVYQRDVRVFEVFDEDGTSIALFYADYFKRDNKAGGAWATAFVGQSTLLEQKPVITNTCNFTKPAPGQPALLSRDDVITMFHEFGHALHGMFSNVKYPLLGGTSVPRDFVEFPSQFNEHWADEPSVFANYAKHYKTGEAMPAALAARIREAGMYDQGFATTEYLGAALLDMAWHTLPRSLTIVDNTDAFERTALKKYDVDYALVPPRYRTSYFAHIWGGGYSAGYYAYLWTAVLRDDAYYWFKEHGGMTRENGQRFRDMVLSRGGTQETDALYRAWRGRDPSVEPLLEVRGLKPAAKTR
ncbi:MAG: M3 family metallopeptidase [Rudaea sp.]|uniref:M3 family metallopeptidase n=1 Tax=unclassified Rudaea TaxID=2627037 RepID=UPI0010F74FAE|nr:MULTISPECIES: M3 family metallopeptidase [unclassified Rudaea]MBN8887050.1 M3 family metallopeptidase [Rudaea sp.]